MEVLAGDIGGTKALLAIVEVEPGQRGPARVVETRRYESRRFPGLEAVCRSFATETGRRLPARAGFGVAGPVVNGRCQATNLPWIIDEAQLSQGLAIERVRLANDFVTLARGLSFVQPKDLAALNEGVRDPSGPVALLGAGTGLGECVILAGQVYPSEGGHTDFAPRSELEVAVLRFLWRRHGHVSWERVLSGDGLVSLAEALADHEQAPLPEPLARLIATFRGDAPALVTELARGGDRLCAQALRLFCTLYGAEAGNLALRTLPTGGVFVAGGIAARILPELSGGTFRDAFLDKGRLRPVLEAIPVHAVLDPLTPLYGAAALAA